MRELVEGVLAQEGSGAATFAVLATLAAEIRGAGGSVEIRSSGG